MKGNIECKECGRENNKTDLCRFCRGEIRRKKELHSQKAKALMEEFEI